MGKRAWLSNLIDNDYLPAIALLSDSPQGRAKAQQLVTRMRQEWSDRGALALNQQQSLMDQTRRAIKDHLGEDHFSLDYIIVRATHWHKKGTFEFHPMEINLDELFERFHKRSGIDFRARS